MLIAATAVFVVFLDSTIVNVGFGAVEAAFPQASRSDLSWVLNSYSVTLAALLIPFGRVADRWGSRLSFILGLLMFGVSSLACALAPTLDSLILSRAIQGAGAALMLPASLTVVLAAVEIERRSQAVAVWGAVGAVAAAAGPVIGAALIESASWRWMFGINVPICVAAAFFASRSLEEWRPAIPKALPNAVSVVLTATIPGLLAFAVVQSPTAGWGAAHVWGALAASAALLPVLVVALRLDGSSALLNLDLLRDRGFSVGNAGTFLFGIAFYANGLCNILFLTEVWNYSVLLAALAIVPAPLLAAAVSRPAERLVERVGPGGVVAAGAAIFCLGQILFALRTELTPDYLADWLVPILLVGVGIGITFPLLSGVAVSRLKPEDYAAGSAVNSVARQLGAVLGASLLIAMLSKTTLWTALQDFHRAWLAIAAVSAVTAVVSLACPVRPNNVTSVSQRNEASL